jgi:hypothetical protein
VVRDSFIQLWQQYHSIQPKALPKQLELTGGPEEWTSIEASLMAGELIGALKRDPMLLNEFEAHSVDRALHAVEPKDLVASVASLAWKLSASDIAGLLNETTVATTQRLHRVVRELDERLEMAMDPPESAQAAIIAWLDRPFQDNAPAIKKTKRSRSAWWIRPLLEGALFVGVLALAFWGVPEIKALYDQAMERKLNSYLLENVITDAPIPKGMEPKAPVVTANQTPASPQTNTNENSQGLTKSAKGTLSKKPPIPDPKVLAGEIWRFSWTGPDPDRTRSMVEDVLKQELGGKPQGNVIPGGIQYDLELMVSQVIPLKHAFETRISLEQSKAAETLDSSGETPTGVSTVPQLSWYKRTPQRQNISKKNHVQVVIWVSTL